MRLFAPTLAALLAWQASAFAFCGFYVATTDQPLTNKASRVVLVRKGGHTVVTMASDVHGDPKQFALVIPVPTVIQRTQVRIVKPEVVEHLADYSKPRLVEYYDPDPCAPPMMERFAAMPAPAPAAPAIGMVKNSTVRIEAAFSVEEYDILVLSAGDSGDLIGWLNTNGYKMPPDAAPVIGSYLRQKMHFFVAKVNLDRMKDNASGFLRPIRVDYDTAKFMLPIRLGTVNAAGPQDMIVLALSDTGRVEVTNYRTVLMPTGINIPEYVQAKFGAFYDATFNRQVARADGQAVFLEYAWPMAANIQLCDPCSSPPFDASELAALGADQPADFNSPLYLTRLHVRYDRAHFPEDLQFQESPNRAPYQARYITQIAWKGQDTRTCHAGREYQDSLQTRWRTENTNLADLTGWDKEEIRKAMVAHWLEHREN